MIENKNQSQQRNQDNLNDEMGSKQSPSTRQDQTRQNQREPLSNQEQPQRQGQQSEGIKNPSTNR